MADLEGVQGVHLNPPLEPNYFIFMGNFEKFRAKLGKRTPFSEFLDPPLIGIIFSLQNLVTSIVCILKTF